MGRKKRQQADHKADLRGGGFIGLPGVVHRSAAYRSLPVFERAVLTEIIATFNGYNNGALVISQRQIADALGNSNFRKIGRAIATLIERGLLDIATDSVWKERKAREYRLTFISSGKGYPIQPATNEYLKWKKYDADGVSAGKAQSADDASATANPAADDASASAEQKPQKCVVGSNLAADGVSSLIVEPYQGPEKLGHLKALKSRRAPSGAMAGTAPA